MNKIEEYIDSLGYECTFMEKENKIVFSTQKDYFGALSCFGLLSSTGKMSVTFKVDPEISAMLSFTLDNYNLSFKLIGKPMFVCDLFDSEFFDNYSDTVKFYQEETVSDNLISVGDATITVKG